MDYNFYASYYLYIIAYLVSTIYLIYVSTTYLTPKTQNMVVIVAYCLTFLSLSGIPITIGFFTKVPFIVLFLKTNFFTNILLLIIFNIITMYVYIHFLTTCIFKKKKKLLGKLGTGLYDFTPIYIYFLILSGFLYSQAFVILCNCLC